MCKLWGTERAWEIVDDTMQIRGGRGYETAESQKGRGEEPVAVERMMRDSRINRIFEGSSEIMRLFLAREALDPHLKIGAPVLNTQLPLLTRAKGAFKAVIFYPGWYARLWFHWKPKRKKPLDQLHAQVEPAMDPLLEKHLRFAERASRKLARMLFHALIWYGPKLETKQILLGRFVDIGTELFAITATCSRAQLLLATNPDKAELLNLADYFCCLSRFKVSELFRALRQNTDRKGCKLASAALEGRHEWLTRGIVRTKYIPPV